MTSQAEATMPVREARMEHATVKAVTDAGLILHGTGGVLTARTAVGCLLEPLAGDRVLVSRSATECFVLQVLARDAAERRVRVPGELAVVADRLTFRARERATVSGGEALDLDGVKLRLQGGETELHSEELHVTGDRARARFREGRLVVTALEVVAGRVAHCARQVIRRVEDIETLQVGNLVQRVRENLILRSKRASVTASGDMQIDGERIHMG